MCSCDLLSRAISRYSRRSILMMWNDEIMYTRQLFCFRYMNESYTKVPWLFIILNNYQQIHGRYHGICWLSMTALKTVTNIYILKPDEIQSIKYNDDINKECSQLNDYWEIQLLIIYFIGLLMIQDQIFVQSINNIRYGLIISNSIWV